MNSKINIVIVPNSAGTGSLVLEGPLQLIKQYQNLIEELPDPEDAGCEAEIWEAKEAVARYEMTRGLRFKLQVAIQQGSRKQALELRKLIAEVLSGPLVADILWTQVEDAKLEGLKQNTLSRALIGEADAVLSVCRELVEVREQVALAVHAENLDALRAYIGQIKR